MKIYSYILTTDSGAAPNPFGGVCTLTICKPEIRRCAQVGDWVIGTGSKNVKLQDGKTVDLSGRIVYAMKITDKKTLQEYDKFCRSSLPSKLPLWDSKDWQEMVGDCIYDYSKSENPSLRKGVHTENEKERDLRGLNALLSKHFYYFGADARLLPPELAKIVTTTQGHKTNEDKEVIEFFEKWISQFEKNKLYADPQLRWEICKKAGSCSQDQPNKVCKNKGIC